MTITRRFARRQPDSGSPRGAIVGMDHAKAVTGDLSQEPTRYANLQISGNRVR